MLTVKKSAENSSLIFKCVNDCSLLKTHNYEGTTR